NPPPPTPPPPTPLPPAPQTPPPGQLPPPTPAEHVMRVAIASITTLMTCSTDGGPGGQGARGPGGQGARGPGGRGGLGGEGLGEGGEGLGGAGFDLERRERVAARPAAVDDDDGLSVLRGASDEPQPAQDRERRPR